MKKLITLTMILVILVTNIAYAETIQLNDIQNHWAKDAVEYLMNLEVINGYDDGTFKPEDNVNVDAFIKMAVTSLGHKLENGKLYWASTYIEKAKELGLVKDGEYINCMRSITRAEMARIIVRALDEEYPANIDEYKSLITDYNSIEDTYKDDIVKAYCKGIITGYDDGSFEPKQNATRAEAATMIVRMLDESKRKVLDLEIQNQETPKEENKEDIKAENYRIINNKLYLYSPQQKQYVDVSKTSTLFTSEELVDIARTVHEFVEGTDKYLYCSYQEDDGDISFSIYPNKSQYKDDRVTRAYFAFNLYTNGNSEYVKKLGKNLRIYSIYITDTANFVPKSDINEYLSLTKAILQKVFKEEYNEKYFNAFSKRAKLMAAINIASFEEKPEFFEDRDSELYYKISTNPVQNKTDMYIMEKEYR